MVYNSWATMQANGESNADTCAYNDLALIKLDPSDVANVNPSVPGYGGPTGVGTVGSLGDKVYSYGNSELRGGVTKLSPKEGVLIQNQGNGWSHNVFTVSPGIPGDSGSGFMNDSGQAIGILSTLQLAPAAGSNGVGDIAKEIAYLHANSSFSGANLVPGTEPFKPDLVGAILGRSSGASQRQQVGQAALGSALHMSIGQRNRRLRRVRRGARRTRRRRSLPYPAQPG